MHYRTSIPLCTLLWLTSNLHTTQEKNNMMHPDKQAHTAQPEATVQSDQDLKPHIKINGIYQHYRGDHYKVLAIACNVEDLSWWVIYEAQYQNKVSQIWSRKVEDFLKVDVWKEGVPATSRFVYIKQAE